MNNEEQLTLIRIKSLLNHLSYIIKDSEKNIVDDYHELVRKYCSYKPRRLKINERRNK
jgi:hypothetical protein